MDFENAFAKCIRTGDVNGIRNLCVDASVVNNQFVCPTPIPQKQREFALPQLNYPTPIVYAIACKQVNVIKELISIGADLNKYYKNWLPIHFAIAVRAPEIVSLLLSIDPEQIQKPTEKSNNLPIHMAVSSGELQTVLILLKNGADVNVMNDNCVSPLWCACFLHDDKILEALIVFGADLNVVDATGMPLTKMIEEKNLIFASKFIKSIATGERKLRTESEILSQLTPENGLSGMSNTQEKIDLIAQRVSAAEEIIEFQNQ